MVSRHDLGTRVSKNHNRHSLIIKDPYSRGSMTALLITLLRAKTGNYEAGRMQLTDNVVTSYKLSVLLQLHPSTHPIITKH